MAPLRPNAVARTEFAQWQLAAGIPLEELYEPSRRISEEWREEHVLVPVDVEREGPLVDLDDVGLRERLDRTHYGLLREHGMSHFDISAIRSRNRQVTQVVSRDLFERDAAGLIFRSNIDDCRCLVAFEGRAELMPEGEEVSLSEDLPELRQVATEFGLLLE